MIPNSEFSNKRPSYKRQKLFLNADLCSADGANAQNVAGACAEGPLNVHLELLEHFQRNKSLDRSREAAAVDSACALAVQ